jgi:hypothetical protein
MPRIHEILSSIHRLEQAVALGERHLAKHPDDFDTSAVVSTSDKLLRKKRGEFAAYVKMFNADPVTYSVYTGKGCDVPHIREICSAFSSFEMSVLLTAQSKLLDQPQHIRKLQPPVAAAALRYGYLASTGPKHLAFVAHTRGDTQLDLDFTFESLNAIDPGHPDRLRSIPDRVLREAASDVIGLAKNRSPKSLSAFAKKNGSAILVEVNDWCNYHTQSLLDIETIWGTGGDAVNLAATSQQMEALHYKLEKLSDEIRFETFLVEGAFYSINTKTRHFSFQADDGRIIGGKFPADMFNSQRPVKVPRRYTVIFCKKVRLNDALGSEVTTYEIETYTEISK